LDLDVQWERYKGTGTISKFDNIHSTTYLNIMASESIIMSSKLMSFVIPSGRESIHVLRLASK
jgi:hypothetical protein